MAKVQPAATALVLAWALHWTRDQSRIPSDTHYFSVLYARFLQDSKDVGQESFMRAGKALNQMEIQRDDGVFSTLRHFFIDANKAASDSQINIRQGR
jgi:hypothetical protein